MALEPFEVYYVHGVVYKSFDFNYSTIIYFYLQFYIATFIAIF